MTASTGLTMIQNGHLYDCVLVDVDIREMDMVDFIHQVLKLQPKLSIIIMVSDDVHMMKFVTEALKNDAILCLVKPCDLSDICNIWNHVCRKKIAREKNNSKGKLPLENNIIRRVDLKPFATLNRAMNNNVTSNEYGAMFKGKQPMDSDRPLEDDTYRTKRKESKPRINWTKALHDAYPSETSKHMNVPGVTRNHVASHLQKPHEGEKISKKPRLVPVVQIDDDLQNHGSKRNGQFTLTPLRNLNSAGMSYMSLENIRARMQESALSSLPMQQPNTTTTMSNSSGVGVGTAAVAPENNLGKSGAINLSNGVENGKSGNAIEAQTPFVFDSCNSLDASGDMCEPLAQFDCFGIPIEPWPVTGMGSVDDHGLEDTTMEPFVDAVVVEEENCNMRASDQTSITNQAQEDLALHEFVSHELGGLYHPQDFQESGESLFMGFLHHSVTSSNGGSVGHVSFPGEGSNSTQGQMHLPVNSNGVYLGGVESAIEDDPFLHMTQFDVERTMQLLDEVDAADLINGPWQFESR